MGGLDHVLVLIFITNFIKRKKDVRYSLDSWKDYFYVHTNEDARDYKILRCKKDDIENLEEFVQPKKETVIGGLDFLDDYIIKAKITSYASITRNRAVDIIDKSIKLDVLTPFDKYAIKLIMRISKGPTDTSKTYDITDWKDVETFTRNLNL